MKSYRRMLSLNFLIVIYGKIRARGLVSLANGAANNVKSFKRCKYINDSMKLVVTLFKSWTHSTV